MAERSRRVPRASIDGLGHALSRLVLGCDNQVSLGDAAPLWDRWWETGGNAFDTAHVYRDGLCERVLGEWLASRGVGAEAVVVVKGAHTPDCRPDAIGPQLARSLDNLGLERAPLYLLHRDDPGIPVDEFVDAIEAERAAGRVGVAGVSNWPVERLAAANAHASEVGVEPLRVLSNNLSLATMTRPVWPGCRSAHDAATREFLRETGIAHLAWSAQARGWFLPERLRGRLPEESSPERCFGGADNAERRRRAEALAARLAAARPDEVRGGAGADDGEAVAGGEGRAERGAASGIDANAVALAWVLAQPFASFALIGPRSIAELDATLAALEVALSGEESAWLDLEREVRPSR